MKVMVILSAIYCRKLESLVKQLKQVQLPTIQHLELCELNSKEATPCIFTVMKERVTGATVWLIDVFYSLQTTTVFPTESDFNCGSGFPVGVSQNMHN